MGYQNLPAARRGVLLFLSILAVAILASTYLWSNAPAPSELVSNILSNKKPPTQQHEAPDKGAASKTTSVGSKTTPLVPEPEPEPPKTPATPESEKGNGGLGRHYHIRPSKSNTSARVAGCEYPLLLHVSPDIHCTGAAALYGSIVHNVLAQPEALQGKVCVHVTYVDQNITTIEDMYQWRAKPNPFTDIDDCAALDNNPELNKIVPVKFQALAPIEKPQFMETRDSWLAALNKVHSWGFDLYPRILILDVDSIVLSDVHKIFDASSESTVVGAPDQFKDCHDRTRINGGMILLQPSRYFHISAAELLHDKQASCFSGKWEQSEQELLNCICGYTYNGYKSIRPEFQCSIMPLYNSVWPRNYGCSGANVVPMRSIHFTGGPKPWNVDEGKLDDRPDTRYWKCLRDSTRSKSLENLKKCQSLTLEDTQKLGDIP